MARRYRAHIREKKAKEFVVTVKGLEEYKNAWLIINNNAREYPDSIYKVSNNSHDDIYVLCPADSKADTKSWLEQFGEVKVYEDKIAVIVDVECDYDAFDLDYVDSELVLGEFD